MSTIKERLLGRIEERGHASLAELRDMDGFPGEYEWLISASSNVVLWKQMSSQAIDALTELEREGRVRLKPCAQFVYTVDGAVLSLPLAKKANHNYKRPHWLPVIVERTA